MAKDGREKREYSPMVEIKDPWKTALIKAGLTSPKTGDPSLQALYRESGVHPSSLSRLLRGNTKNPKVATLSSIAKALEVPVVEVASWVGLTWDEMKPWEPPEESQLLTQTQRELISELIRQLTRR